MVEQFENSKGHAHKIKALWNEIATKIGEGLKGEVVRTKYNYLVKEFRHHHTRARASGEGAVKWQFYTLLKSHLLRDPSVVPPFAIESQSFGDSPAVEADGESQFPIDELEISQMLSPEPKNLKTVENLMNSSEFTRKA